MPKYLFIDDDIVENVEGLQRVLNPACKHPKNPLLRADFPWEQRLLYVYGTVLYDEQEKVFKMWYQVWSGPGRRWPSRWKICYATSEDGLEWHRPPLGLAEVEGSKENNVVSIHHIPSVIYDSQEADEQKRYKMFFCPGVGYGVSFSKDGVHWNDYPGNPVLSGGDVAPTIYDEQSGWFVSFPKVHPLVGRFRRRSVGISFSPDFLRWTPSVLVLAPDEKDDAIAEERIASARPLLEFDDAAQHRSEFYGMAAMPYEGICLGFLWVFDASAQVPQGNQDGPVEVQLTYSRDLARWQRAGERRPILPRGPTGEWDCGMVYTVNRPILVGEEIWLYYGGMNMTHGSQIFYPGHPDDPSKQSGIGLAIIRRDGFVSLDAGEKQGLLLTKPFPVAAKALTINAQGEYVAAEVLNGEGRAIPGFESTACLPFSGDAISHSVAWKGQKDLSPLQGKAIRLRLQLRKAKLYSFALA